MIFMYVCLIEKRRRRMASSPGSLEEWSWAGASAKKMRNNESFFFVLLIFIMKFSFVLSWKMNNLK